MGLNSKNILYVYPQWHMVSFTLVARKHIEYMQRLGAAVYEIDEVLFPGFAPVVKYSAFIHPAFYILHRVAEYRKKLSAEYLNWLINKFEQLICIDVADSDRISEYAVNLLNMCTKVVVPSTFARDAYVSSGVKKPVYIVPHGVDPFWYTAPNTWLSAPAASIHPMILQLFLYKIRKGVKIILFWLWHSPDRKGWHEAREIYKRVRRERKDVMLVLKTINPNTSEFLQVADQGAVEVYGWLDEFSKMALYDLADIVLVPSRGGAFELNALEALARGVPTLATDYGCFLDYVPDFLRIKKGEKVLVLPGNAIHIGFGYTADVDDGVQKVLNILHNYEEYKAKTVEWRENVLKNRFRWDLIAKQLLSLIP